MVLESLLNPFRAEKNPWEMFFVGFLYSSVAIILSLWIFSGEASLVMVFFTVMACIPIIYNTIRFEERKDMVVAKEKNLLHEHNKAIIYFLYLFMGITLSCVVWYVFLPANTVNSLFAVQTQTIESINNMVSGRAFGRMGEVMTIFSNNVKVLIFAIIFSFIYGAGAIFILTWNATVIGTAIGKFIRSNLSLYASLFGFEKISGYFQVVSVGLLKYSLHGIPEILGYFYGGLAGGIISVAIINKHYQDKKFSKILTDVSHLLLLSLFYILMAALIEVYVTPILF